MFKIGDKVKIIINNLNPSGLIPEENLQGYDYLEYIKNNVNKIYTIVKIISNITYPYVLDDEILCNTSFAENELEKVI